jgi:hypothetical protein
MEDLALIYDRPPTNDVGRIRGHGSKSKRGAPTASRCCLLLDDDPRASTALLSARVGAVASRDDGFARLVVLAAFAVIVDDAVVALWQRGDYFMRR